MEKNYFIDNEKAMLHAGAKLASICEPGMIIFLSGELGAGKTTLARGFLRSLGISGIVKSPTYTLVESYQVNDLCIHHFDLYRLHDAEELLHLGLSDYLTKDAICLIEWPERAVNILPEPTVYCTIEVPFTGVGRKLNLCSQTPVGLSLMAKFQLRHQ